MTQLATERTLQMPAVEQMLEAQGLEDHHIKWLGSRGRFQEIAPMLSQLVGSIQTIAVPIPDALRGDFQPSTPSIAMHDGARRAIVRGVNYRQAVDQQTIFSGEDRERCCTRNWWIEFDERWRPKTARIIADPYPERPGVVQGYEDCRLFWAGGWRASCTFAERMKLYGEGGGGLLCEMALLNLSAEGQIERVGALRGPWSIYHQKNWKPAPTEAEPLRWIYASDPLTLVTPAMATWPHSSAWVAASAWRGGSQAIRWRDCWLWVDHRPIVRFDGPRHLYLHRFALADEALTRVKAVSPPFVFQGYGVEFCAGLAVDGDTAALSYSVKDATSLVALCDLDAVLRTLEDV